ncbi:hypothetical protein IFR05_011731 [Cadophora sp. M221]|nr:hypothetical protein IFR05_011731 [Cadophora sp. M221]
MMYNQQQYGVGPGQGHPQSQFPGAPGPSMGGGGGGNAGAMGMMQNNGMAQMAAGHVPPYQTPYSSSPYGGNIPTSTAANLPPNFMPPTSGAPSFPMNAMNMNPQHQAQRMQPPPPSSTPTQPGPRASPFAGIPHNTPPNAGPQSQFSPPQQSNQAHLQTPNNNQQVQSGTILTPQTPNFPPGQQGPNANQAMATPLSPGSESREKERVTLLLDINRELLMEVMKIQAAQAAQAEAKKEETAASPEAGNKEKTEQEKEKVEKEKAEKSKPSSREYVECMRRLQSNLAYLAAIADRSHKPSSQIPPHPAIMTAPIVTPKPALAPASSPNSDSKDADEKKGEEKKAEEDENRAEILKEQYKKLQALFPGVDPKKEPQMQGGNPAMRAQAQQHAAAQMQAQAQKQQQQQHQGQGQIQGQSQDPNSQQKLQNDLLRQKMMMQQQAQQNAQQQMAQNMQNMNQQGLGR